MKNLNLRQKILLGIGIPVLMALLLGAVNMFSLHVILQSNNEVESTYKLILQARQVQKSAVDMETGLRGYLLTGRSDFLEPYESGVNETFSQISSLRDAVSHNPRQVERLNQMEEILRQWQQDVSQPNIELRRNSPELDRLTRSITLGPGKKYFDRFRSVMDSFISEEHDLLEARHAKTHKNIRNTVAGTLLCILLAALTGFLISLKLSRHVLQQVGGEPQKIAALAKDVADGKLQHDIRQESSVGILAALSEMVEQLDGIVSEVNTVVSRVAQGDITARGNPKTYSGHWKELIESINLLIDKIAEQFDRLPTPFSIIDTEFNVRYINRQASQWIGRPRAELIGQKCYDIFRTGHCQTEHCACARAMQSGKPQSAETQANPGQREIFVSYDGVPIKNQDGKIIGAMDIFTDQTARKNEDWIKSGQTALSQRLNGELNPEGLTQNALNFLADYLEAQVGACYLADETGQLQLVSSYAYKLRNNNFNSFRPGESLIGQVALEKRSVLFRDLPPDHSPMEINSGLGISAPDSILVFPLLQEEDVLGVMALGRSGQFSSRHMELIERATESIAVSLNSAQARQKVDKLLSRSQSQAEELEAQQEELKQTNAELEQQAEELKTSQERLQNQQEELRITNEELTSKSAQLEQQNAYIQHKNLELENSRQDLDAKAQQLQQATRYKSEFLANMSHELRTPLNSLLLLARNLSANKSGNLTEKQINDAQIIYRSGQDLLNLINDILDLSKIESGKMGLNLGSFKMSDVAASMRTTFGEQMAEKKLDFRLIIDDDAVLRSDRQKLEQILKNLLSNALKFTDQGSVELRAFAPASPEMIAVSVHDSGTGIAPEKHDEIFEAFQQADGTIVRKYGGTGLGLSICDQLARLLGGRINLESSLGQGSTFTLQLKRDLQPQQPAPEPETSQELPDNGRQTILIIEDDPNFAAILQDICRERDLHCLHSLNGEEGLKLLKTHTIDALILDLKLPDMDGWSVLNQIKGDKRTRHIPVHIMSVEESPANIKKRGVAGYLQKPISREKLEQAFNRIGHIITGGVKKLLIVEDDALVVENLQQAFSAMEIQIDVARTGEDAYQMISRQVYDCIILDMILPDASGLEIMQRLDGQTNLPPVIVYTAKELSDQECLELNKYASSMIFKGTRSGDRLIDEVALFLHTVVESPSSKELHDESLRDKKIMIVDDDVRNIYSVITALEDCGITFVKAGNGQMALDELRKHPDTDLILMDIMMPVMDGYEAMRQIRQIPEYEKLPILALTAKGMQQDRQECFAAGATDYLMKPVDPDKLLSSIRVWLHE